MFKGMNRKRRNSKGFSLVELIVVVAILGILAAVAVPSVIGYLDNAKVNTDKSNAKEIEAAILRNVAKNQITLPATSAGPVLDKVYLEIDMPKPEQGDTFGFYMDKETGRVQCVDKDAGNASSDTLILLE